MTLVAFSRPFWTLFLHVLGAMTTFGAILTAVVLSLVAWRMPDAAFLRRATLTTLLVAVDHQQIFEGSLKSFEGSAVESVLWLAESLRTRGRSIDAGMNVVASCCPTIFQAVAGHSISVAFGAAEAVTIGLS